MIGIYKITNLINGKVYIGQSINIKIVGNSTNIRLIIQKKKGTAQPYIVHLENMV